MVGLGGVNMAAFEVTDALLDDVDEEDPVDDVDDADGDDEEAHGEEDEEDVPEEALVDSRSKPPA